MEQLPELLIRQRVEIEPEIVATTGRQKLPYGPLGLIDGGWQADLCERRR